MTPQSCHGCIHYRQSILYRLACYRTKSFKSGGDAIAELCGVDDSDWEVTYVRGESVKGGAVIVEVLV